MTNVTHELVREAFDYSDGCLYWAKTVKKTMVGKRAGTPDGKGYRQIYFNKSIHREHRLIWLWHNKSLPCFIDHINGVRNDNRIENLREATKGQNAHNAKISPRNKSGIKNVYFESCTQKWRVAIKNNGKTIRFGRYKNKEIASTIAKLARHKYHADFANHG